MFPESLRRSAQSRWRCSSCCGYVTTDGMCQQAIVPGVVAVNAPSLRGGNAAPDISPSWGFRLSFHPPRPPSSPVGFCRSAISGHFYFPGPCLSAPRNCQISAGPKFRPYYQTAKTVWIGARRQASPHRAHGKGSRRRCAGEREGAGPRERRATRAATDGKRWRTWVHLGGGGGGRRPLDAAGGSRAGGQGAFARAWRMPTRPLTRASLAP